MEGSASSFNESYLEKAREVGIEANIDVRYCRDAQIMIVHSYVNIKTDASLLNKNSCLAPTLGVTKFIIVKAMILVTLCSTN